MAFQAVPNGVEVVFNATQNSVPIVNVYHVQTPSAIDDTVLLEISEVFFDWWQTSCQAALHNSYVLNTIVAKDLSVANGHEVVTILTTDNTGGAGDDPAAANAALVLSWRTANTGRSFRGRSYMGGLPNAVLADAQHMGTGETAAWATRAADLIDALETAGYVLAVLSRVAAGVQRITGLLTQIISVVVDTKLDSQRRRTAN